MESGQRCGPVPSAACARKMMLPPGHLGINMRIEFILTKTFTTKTTDKKQEKPRV
ncbi:Uncharacterized protein ChrSV_4354 [Chromobacterium vaccinii]|nr:Uncharacterized protein ChrSW_4354 [Chromobacterium vaccinii]QND91811.1 Uncharacterized protein ChrSV_4354 [Chromobacterium vaccinii]